MPRHPIIAAFLVAFAFLYAGVGLAQSTGPARVTPVGTLPTGTLTLAPLLRNVVPAVVSIAVTGRAPAENPLLSDPFFRRFFSPREKQPEQVIHATGSGVIVDAQRGYVLTNAHVVENAQRIVATLRDGRHFEAKLVGRDPETDLALVKISGSGLVALPLGDSDAVEVGDFVVAIGNPFGLGQTVTSGIVSAVGRSGLGIEGYEDFIQTDAAINPGNSGGALINLKGELIGINTAIVAPSEGNVGIGFAIPINMARNVIDQLEQSGEVRRGQLGVALRDRADRGDPSYGLLQGAIVAEVTPGSSAANAGLRAGDVIVKLNGVPIRDAQHLRNRIGLMRVGQPVEFEIDRNGQAQTITATIGPRTSP